jgi:predicted transcriptional regulator of viral defense system
VYLGSIEERALTILKRSRKDLFTAEIHKRMKDVAVASLRSALKRLADRKAVERPEWGVYRFAEEVDGQQQE